MKVALRFSLLCMTFLATVSLYAQADTNGTRYREYANKLESLKSKQAQLKLFFQSASGLQLYAAMVAKSDNNHYEIILGNGAHAVLNTHDTVFNAPGNFSLLAKMAGTRKVKTMNGWDREVQIFEELDGSEKLDFESKTKELTDTKSEITNVARLMAASRFSRDGAGVITDYQTSLQWLEGPDQMMNWNSAQAWLKSLGGGWRAPTVKEVFSLWGSNPRYPDDTLVNPVFHLAYDEDSRPRSISVFCEPEKKGGFETHGLGGRGCNSIKNGPNDSYPDDRACAVRSIPSN